MQSLVQSHDELRMENYQLKEKLNRVEDDLELMQEKYDELSDQMQEVMRTLEELSTSDGTPEKRRCSGLESYDSCYELSDDMMNYNQGKAYCKRQGGMLATWSLDMNVHRELLDYAQGQGISSDEYIWIGASYDSKTDRSLWADGREVDIKVTRFTKQTSCGAIFKRYIAGFKCGNDYR